MEEKRQRGPRRESPGRSEAPASRPRGQVGARTAEELLELADELEEEGRALISDARQLQRLAERMGRGGRPDRGERGPRGEGERPARSGPRGQGESRERRRSADRGEGGSGRPSRGSGDAPSWSPPGKRKRPS